jgi:ATP-dependent DNA helicase RecG
LDAQVASLPFNLTSAQNKAIADVRADLASGHPMNRLLQGDVGSGKTVVAALGIAMVVRHSSQAALMAPTSILAEQHFSSMKNLLAGEKGTLAGHQIRLMIGATPESEKQDIRQGLANGEIKLVIGTHALIEDPVTFADLQLTIIDEQHRFGVEQRAALRAKGHNPHLMVMTATPIPRSLALTVYGDLDLLVMDEMPPGRQVVETHILLPRERERGYSLIRNQVSQGHQVFIIYPLVENTDSGLELDAEAASKAAVDEHRRLQSEVFPDLQLSLMHGRLKPDEKEQAMARFRDGETQIMVSTSVVEVGVDIPNATVMLIEGANRFGLAQLHQFRGRVGRGTAKSYCLLIPETEDAAENERLSAMVTTNDGFELADIDLNQRGPGDFLGTRQSGYTKQLQMASLTDFQLIEKAQRSAKALFEQDPDLSLPQNRELAATLAHFWGQNGQAIQADIS